MELLNSYQTFVYQEHDQGDRRISEYPAQEADQFLGFMRDVLEQKDFKGVYLFHYRDQYATTILKALKGLELPIREIVALPFEKEVGAVNKANAQLIGMMRPQRLTVEQQSIDSQLYRMNHLLGAHRMQGTSFEFLIEQAYFRANVLKDGKVDHLRSQFTALFKEKILFPDVQKYLLGVFLKSENFRKDEYELLEPLLKRADSPEEATRMREYVESIRKVVDFSIRKNLEG